MNKYIIIIAGLFIALSHITAAENNLTVSDSILLKAMTDELDRNMNELTIHDHPKPFFISYTVSDAHSLIVRASNGALVNSQKDHTRGWSTRVMVGDYEINDENYEGSNVQSEQEIDDLAVPLDDDYFGIRRALWLATNNVYKRAAAKYKDKMSVIASNNIDTKKLIADFGKEPVVKKYITSEKLDVDQKYYEDLARELSEIFVDHKEIYSSSITFGIINTDIYFVNSEGTELKVPYNLCEIQISAVATASNGQYIPGSISYHAIVDEQIPSKESIESDISLLIDYLKEMDMAEIMEDSYSGPVLFDGQAVPEIFVNNMFLGQNSLVAQREPLYSHMDMSMYYGDSNNQLEKKLGKKITSIDFSIIAKPFQNEYEGIPLIGSFSVDAEGVIPPESLILVENTFLKNLLNDRTPTRYVEGSNGHNRFSARYGYVTKHICPGVIEIKSNEAVTYNELKSKLVQMAADEGYDYALVLKSIKDDTHNYPKAFYKVDLETGEEKMIRSVRVGMNPFNLLRNIEGFSNDIQINNLLYGSPNTLNNSYLSMYDGGGLLNGTPASFITPGALLLKNFEVEGIKVPMTNISPSIEPPEKE